MRFTGRVIDADTNQGVPSATVELWIDNVMLARAIADSTGNFTLSSTATPDLVKISSAGYSAVSFDFKQVVDDSLFPIEKYVKEEGNVTVTASTKKSMLWLGLAALLLLLFNDKKS